jgi:Histidine kinase-, DNA gyrase B-, and HSP90-like ATPase
MFNTALNADSRLWRAGCWSRAALLAGIWITLAWAPATGLLRAFAQLLVASAGLLLGFASITPGGRELVAKVPGTAVLVNHLGTFQRAAVDAPALVEGLGAFLAGSLYAGWFPLAGWPSAVRSVGLAMAVCFGWETVLQAVIHPSWYNRDAPPGRAMRMFRYTIPAIFAGFITFVLLPWNAADTQVSLVVRILLSASPLVYYPLWAVFDIMLKASVTSLRNSETLLRWDVWGEAHGSVKNTLVFLNQYVEEPEPDLEEIRSLTRNALVVMDEFKGQLVGGRAQGPAGGSVGELWGSVLRALGSPRRVRCVLDGESAQVRLCATDYQVARRVLPDLVSNALKAGASAVDARCSVRGQPAEVRIEIADDGAGLTADDISDPRSSLRLLRAWLHERKGDIRHAANTVGGTTAVAYWRADRAHGHGLADSEFLSPAEA